MFYIIINNLGATRPNARFNAGHSLMPVSTYDHTGARSHLHKGTKRLHIGIQG